MKRLILALVCACVASTIMAAAVEDEVVRAVGMAGTYRGAVNEALVSALEQHDGITVSAVEVNAATQSDTSSSTRTNGRLDENARLAIDDSIAKEMKKWAKGKIRGYDVVSDQVVGDKYRVELAVRFVGKYQIGLAEGNRRRMAVALFRPATGDTIRWFGQVDSASAWTAQLAEKLNVRLTQTRKFTMLDRAFDAEVNGELSRLGSANAAPADAVRLNQKLGTDYLVVGEVRFCSVVAPGVNPLTGQPLPMPSQKFAEVAYRVLLAPTGQLKWADTVSIDACAYPASSISEFATLTADAAAAFVVEGMMANILPFEIVGRNGAGELIVGEGGKSVSVGDRFTVYALGEEVKDTRTGEVLDQIEEPVGDVEIIRVSAKISYARVLGGDVSKMSVGARLRRVAAPAPQPAPAPTTTTVQGTVNGGVVTPF